MADDRIKGDVFPLKKLFDRVTYAIEVYQREYEWTAEHVQVLLTDLFEEFETAERARPLRRRRERAAPFFLGPFVYAEEGGERRFLVDGQQRFTTLHLIFLHLYRLSTGSSKSKLDRAIVADYQGRRPRFRLDIEERQEVLEALYQDRRYEIRLRDSLSVRNLWARSAQIEDALRSRLDSERVDRFVDWLLDNVVMAGIEAVDRNNGFRIFESMNDRGARLTPVDLMKSFLLSRARNDEEKLNRRWRDMLLEVTRVRGDTTAPLQFLKATLLAQFADVSEDSQDTLEVDLAPHVWIRSNPHKLNLREGDDSYSNFVDALVRLGQHYANLAAATTEPRFEHRLESLYYNHVNGLTAQMALIMATVKPEDTLSQVHEKARVAANFIDLLYVVRTIHDEPTHPEDLNQEILHLIPAARECDTAKQLAERLGKIAPTDSFNIVRTFGLRGDNRAQVRYLLGRLTAYVESQMNQPVEIDKYLSSDRGWQIEHLFANHAEWHAELDAVQFRLMHNRLGGLGLLPRADNASIQDLPFHRKVEWYSRHNTLLAALSPSYERNHPTLNRLRTSHGLKGVLRAFGSKVTMQTVIEARGELYYRLFQRIWDPAALGLIIPTNNVVTKPTSPTISGGADEHVGLSHAKPNRRKPRTSLGTLVANGRILPGSRLHAVFQGTRREAGVDAEGMLWLTEHDSFRSLDEAGKMVTDRKTCTGWTFWHITLRDGTSVTLRQFRDDPELSADPPRP